MRTFGAQQVYRSLDGGATWTSFNNGATNVAASDVALDPADPARVFLAKDWGPYRWDTGLGAWVGMGNKASHDVAVAPGAPARVGFASENGTLVSHDAGATWSVIGLSGLSLATYDHLAMAFHPTDPATVYAATADGVFAHTTVVVPPPANTVAPTVTGTAQAGQEVGCDTGTWTNASSFGIAWTLDGAPTFGTSTHTVTADEVGHALRCVVTAMGSGGSTTLASDAVTPVAAPVVVEPPVDPPAVVEKPVAKPPVAKPPVETPTAPASAPAPAAPPAPAPVAAPRAVAPAAPAPRVAGRARVGQTLRCSAPRGARVAWTRNGKPIKGARGARYRLKRADAGRRIACRVTVAGTTRSSRPTGRVARR
jgi:hypothetical protein